MTYKLDFIAYGQVIFQQSIGVQPISELESAAQEMLAYINSVEYPCYLLTDSSNLKSTETNLIRIRDIYKPLTDHPRFMCSIVYGSNDMVALNFVINTLSKILRVNAYMSSSQADAIDYLLKLAPHLNGILQADLQKLADAERFDRV